MKIYRDKTGEINIDISKVDIVLIGGCLLGIIMLVLANI